ncbi:MAG: hypothetical protein V3R89_08615 [Thermoanaerobaculia bacterium]
MTKLLAKAFDLASKLPQELQDQLAAELLQELADEETWDEALAASASQLEQLAEKALEEYRSGRTTELGFDEL